LAFEPSESSQELTDQHCMPFEEISEAHLSFAKGNFIAPYTSLGRLCSCSSTVRVHLFADEVHGGDVRN
jgi:hypothetical protein